METDEGSVYILTDDWHGSRTTDENFTAVHHSVTCTLVSSDNNVQKQMHLLTFWIRMCMVHEKIITHAKLG